jgi:hypothetical protein
MNSMSVYTKETLLYFVGMLHAFVPVSICLRPYTHVKTMCTCKHAYQIDTCFGKHAQHTHVHIGPCTIHEIDMHGSRISTSPFLFVNIIGKTMSISCKELCDADIEGALRVLELRTELFYQAYTFISGILRPVHCEELLHSHIDMPMHTLTCPCTLHAHAHIHMPMHTFTCPCM